MLVAPSLTLLWSCLKKRYTLEVGSTIRLQSSLGRIDLSLREGEVSPPLYYAASVGVSTVVERLLEGAQVSAQVGRYGSATAGGILSW